jgi:hypothetical protein
VAADGFQMVEGFDPRLIGPGAAGAAAEGHAVGAAVFVARLRVAAVWVDQLTDVGDLQPLGDKQRLMI